MTKQEIEVAVRAAYKKEYGWEVQVTEVVLDTFGGHIAVTRATTQKGNPNEELCFIYPEGGVRIFRSTEELARFLEQKARAPLLERIFYRPTFAGIVFLILLVVVIVVGFFGKGRFLPEALTLLGGILGSAAGFFFGTNKPGK